MRTKGALMHSTAKLAVSNPEQLDLNVREVHNADDVKFRGPMQSCSVARATVFQENPFKSGFLKFQVYGERPSSRSMRATWAATSGGSAHSIEVMG